MGIWPKKILNSMHELKSAILAILPEIGRLAGLACPLSAALHFLRAEMEIILFIHFYPPKYAHGRSLRHILDKITKWYFLGTSNEVIWPKIFFNSMHGLKSAILAI